MALHNIKCFQFDIMIFTLKENVKLSFFSDSCSQFSFPSPSIFSIIWKVAISPRAANSELTGFGHVALSLDSLSVPMIKTHLYQAKIVSNLIICVSISHTFDLFSKSLEKFKALKCITRGVLTFCLTSCSK